MKTIITELVPSSSRKSFYGKAHIVESNGWHYLKSYNTIVGGVDNYGKVHRFFDDKTYTTSCHIRSFLDQFSNTVKSTSDFYKLDCEHKPTIIVKL